MDLVHDETPSVGAPPTTQLKKKGRRARGKPSSLKHQDEFRARKNVERLASYRQELLERLKVPQFEKIHEEVTRMQLCPNAYSRQLPITTRAAGFLSALTFHRIVAADVKVRDVDFDIHCMYRVVLALQAVQLELAEQKLRHKPRFVSTVECMELVIPDGFKNCFIKIQTCFSSLACAIMPLGVFEYQNIQYRTVIIWTNADAGTAPIAEPTTTRKRPRVAGRTYVPDPFTVTIENLRPTVEFLSDPGSDAATRQYFRRWSPIPGAIWSPDNVLQNPDDVIPPNYMETSGHWRRDCSRFQLFVDAASRRSGFTIMPISLNGEGDPRCFVGTTHRSCGPYSFVELDRGTSVVSFPDDTNFGSICPLDDFQFALGAIGLLGEHPPRGLSRQDTESGDGYGIRAPSNLVTGRSFDYQNMVEALFTR